MKIFSENQKHLNGCILHGFIAIIGIVLLFFHSNLGDAIYNKILVISPSSFLIDEWTNPTGPIRVDLYFFNWTNPQDFANKSIKPKFKEFGPYVLNEEFFKVNIEFNENHTVTYRNNKTFYFDEEKSSGKMTDEITTINLVPIMAVDKGKNWNFFMRKALSIALNAVPYEVTKKIQDMLFEGYEDALLSSTKYLPFLDDFPDLDKFAWFYKRNGSINFEGVYEIGTGLGNTTTGKLYNWNYKSKGPYPGNCSDIHTSAGELYEQKLTRDKLKFFFSDFCRTIALDYREDVTAFGLPALKFVANTSFFDEGNPCLCPRKCLKSGVLDYSSCKYTAPIYLSYPHFMNADSSYREEIEGMNPDPKKHESYLIVNDRTGIAFDGKIAMQLNVLVEPTDKISKYRDVPERLFPVFWFEVRVGLSEGSIPMIKILLALPLIIRIASSILILIGAALGFYHLHKYLNGIKKIEKIHYPTEILHAEEMKPLGGNDFQD